MSKAPKGRAYEAWNRILLVLLRRYRECSLPLLPLLSPKPSPALGEGSLRNLRRGTSGVKGDSDMKRAASFQHVRDLFARTQALFAIQTVSGKMRFFGAINGVPGQNTPEKYCGVRSLCREGGPA